MTKPAKVKQVCAAPPKIIVHQAQPIVEFRNDGPSSCAPRPVVEDRAVRPVGGDLFGHGGCNTCGGAGAGTYIKSKTKNYFQGVGGMPSFGAAPAQFGTQTVMTAVPLQVQAFVPQTVQTMAVQTFVAPVAAQTFAPAAVGPAFAPAAIAPAAVPAFAPQAVVPSFAASAMFAPHAAASSFGVNAMSPADAAMVQAVANLMQGAATVQPRSQAAAATVTATAAENGRLSSLEARVESIEKRLKALCETR